MTSWYQSVTPTKALTQGDIIFNCPVIGWSHSKSDFKFNNNELTIDLKSDSQAFRIDAIVMTQACDLAQKKVRNVILCSHISLTDYRHEWHSTQKAAGQNPTDKSFEKFFKRIEEGHIWNLAVLNSGGGGELATEHRIVDFADVYSVPRVFLDELIKSGNKNRLSLLPPYREHLSQAFARFFMRVGLPTSVKSPFPSAQK